MKRSPIPTEIYKKLLDACIFGGPGSEFFKDKIGPYSLTEDQIDELTDRLMNSHTAVVELGYAQEATAYLESLKNRD